MKTYTVEITDTRKFYLRIEAESKEGAKKLGYDAFNNIPVSEEGDYSPEQDFEVTDVDEAGE